MRLRWVCSRSHGHSRRSVRTSSAKRTSSVATGAASFGILERGEVVGLERPVEVGPRDLEDGFVGQAEALQHDDRRSPAVRLPSTASLISESTARVSHCATSSGPRSPAASTPNRCPSTSRTPAASGSTPSRAHARSRNDSAGRISTSTRDRQLAAARRCARRRAASPAPRRAPPRRGRGGVDELVRRSARRPARACARARRCRRMTWRRAPTAADG